MQFGVSQGFQSLRGAILHNTITTYWFLDVKNFGDLITPLLLKHYGFSPLWALPQEAQVLSTGSILQNLPESYSGLVLGAGLLWDKKLPLPQATVLGVRGELTRERIGAPKDVLLGDPGLLLSRLYENRRNKSHALGLIPHYLDWKDPRISQISRRYKKEILVINVMREPHEVIREIDRCECILSSSLHGLIVADSLGIPSAHLNLSGKVLEFKFQDYSSAIGANWEPVDLDGTETLSLLRKYPRNPPSLISEIQDRLDAAFRLLKRMMESKQRKD
jgi:pyruvyltransferase